MSYKTGDTHLHAGGVFYLYKEWKDASDFISVYCRVCDQCGAVHKSKIITTDFVPTGFVPCMICGRHIYLEDSNV